MNKYQKALEILMSKNIKLCIYNDVDFEQQPSLFDLYHSELFALQELVNKETPKKIDINIFVEFNGHDFENHKTGICDCGNEISDDFKYCPFCGQKIDWGEDDE